MTVLVRSEKPDDLDIEGLRHAVVGLEAMLESRSTDFGRLQSTLETFRIRYREQVGQLHEKLDQLELEIAEAELGELSKHVADGGASQSETLKGARAEPALRYTSDAVRKLFRDVAKAVHPDLAGDEQARERRHALMVEANRAYAMGDEEQLRWILHAWERSPEAVRGTDPDAARQRLVRRIEEVEHQLNVLVSEQAALEGSPLGKLKALVDEAATRGKDLVREMVDRLKRDIMVATNRLEAMRPPR